MNLAIIAKYGHICIELFVGSGSCCVVKPMKSNFHAEFAKEGAEDAKRGINLATKKRTSLRQSYFKILLKKYYSLFVCIVLRIFFSQVFGWVE